MRASKVEFRAGLPRGLLTPILYAFIEDKQQNLKNKATDLRQMPGEERALRQEKMSGFEFIDKQILFCRPVEFYFIS